MEAMWKLVFMFSPVTDPLIWKQSYDQLFATVLNQQKGFPMLSEL